MKEFNHHVSEVVNTLKHKRATSPVELETYLKNSKYKELVNAPVLPRADFAKLMKDFDQGKVKRPVRLIANTKDQGMGHWVAIWFPARSKKRYLYCSNGLNFEQLFLGTRDPNRHSSQQQLDNGEMCGHFALAWLQLTVTNPKEAQKV